MHWSDILDNLSTLKTWVTVRSRRTTFCGFFGLQAVIVMKFVHYISIKLIVLKFLVFFFFIKITYIIFSSFSFVSLRFFDQLRMPTYILYWLFFNEPAFAKWQNTYDLNQIL